jgi:hypothetical protein
MTEDAIDRMIQRAAREEQEEIDRSHGEHLLEVTDYARRSQRQDEGLVEILNRAHQAKASEAETDQQ